MNLIKEEVLFNLAKCGYFPEEDKLDKFYKSIRIDGICYKASWQPNNREYRIEQSETNHNSIGDTIECSCLWTSSERGKGDLWYADDDFIKDGWKSYDYYGRSKGFRFPGYTGHSHIVNFYNGFALLWNTLVRGGDEAIQEYVQKIQKFRKELYLQKKIKEKKEHIEKRNADPEWSKIKEEVKQLRTTPEGKVAARKVIQAYLQREKQKTR